MAARSGSSAMSVGTIAVLSVALLGCFILAVVLYARQMEAEQNYAALVEDVRDFVRDAERQQDDIQQVRDLARRQNMSVVGYLNSSLRGVMEKTTGSRRDTPERLASEMERIEGGDRMNLLQIVRDRETRLATAESQLRESRAARDRALQDRENAVQQVAAIRRERDAEVERLKAEVSRYAEEIDSYRRGLNVARNDMEERVARIDQESREREAELNARISELQRDLVLANDTVRRLQEEMRGQRVMPTDEYALVDAEVVGIDAAENLVYIDVGARDKVVLGLRFEVYDDATTIRPDRDGNYPRGKATIEVVRIDENVSACRIVRQARGNPVVRGDVVANAVYDPDKIYTFLVFGNFDTTRDGRATTEGREDIVALIRRWGGTVVGEMTGDIDFIVLGQRPVLPPPPRSGAPVPVIEEYMRLRQTVNTYDRLFEQAVSASIPILNENRLMTLTGLHAGR